MPCSRCRASTSCRPAAPAARTSVFIRGTNSNHVKVQIDGIDVNDPSTPNRAFDFSQLQTYDLSRIEVLRGPQAASTGADAIGASSPS